MARTHPKHTRVYINGYDLSGYSRSIGSLGWMFDAQAEAAFTDGAKNIVMGQCDITAGPLNLFLDNDTAGAKALLSAGTLAVNMMVAIGANAAPAAGDPIFAWQFEETSFAVDQGAGFVVANVPMMTSYASNLTYKRPWGIMTHALGAETAVNTAVGIDDIGASSALGGIFVYHLTTSNGTVTLKMQDAATNVDGSFSDLSGATSGSITAAVTPASGMVSLGITATVRQYLRWQLVFGTATTATFTLGFIRNSIA